MEDVLLKNFRSMSDDMQEFMMKMSIGLAREFPRQMAQIIAFPPSKFLEQREEPHLPQHE